MGHNLRAIVSQPPAIYALARRLDALVGELGRVVPWSSVSPIDTALSVSGASRGPTSDEVDALGLARFRNNGHGERPTT